MAALSRLSEPIPRRRLFGTALAGPAVWVRRAGAGTRTLSVAQWMHFDPGYDEWFDRTFARQWGDRHGVRVTVDHLSVADLRARALTEVAAQQGHDLFGLPWPPPTFEPHTLALDDLVAECERRFGRLLPLAHRCTHDPRTGRYFAFAESWAPAPLHYRADLWGEIGVRPDTWEELRDGARRIRERWGVPAGFGLAPEPDSNAMLRGLLWSFGATEQDEAGRVTLNSPATVEALRFMAALFREAMGPEVFTWDPASNNRAYVWGRASVIQNAISALRTAEKLNPELARRTVLAPPPAGRRGRLSPPHVVHCYVVWKFARHPDLAKRFLVDLVAAAPAALAASELYNLPTFPGAVPDLRARVATDPQTPRVYLVLLDADQWSVGLGYPGYATAAAEEALHAHVIPRMFARVARGELTAEQAAARAEAELRRVVTRWAGREGTR